MVAGVAEQDHDGIEVEMRPRCQDRRTNARAAPSFSHGAARGSSHPDRRDERRSSPDSAAGPSSCPGHGVEGSPTRRGGSPVQLPDRRRAGPSRRGTRHELSQSRDEPPSIDRILLGTALVEVPRPLRGPAARCVLPHAEERGRNLDRDALPQRIAQFLQPPWRQTEVMGPVTPPSTRLAAARRGRATPFSLVS